MANTPYDFLVPELQKRGMKAEEIIQILKVRDLNYSRGGFDNCIQVLSLHYALFEPRRCFYKILTDADIEAYRNELVSKKKHKE